MVGQKGAFLDVAKNKSGIQKSEYTGELCSREQVHKCRKLEQKNSSSGLSLALGSR